MIDRSYSFAQRWAGYIALAAVLLAAAVFIVVSLPAGPARPAVADVAVRPVTAQQLARPAVAVQRPAVAVQRPAIVHPDLGLLAAQAYHAAHEAHLAHLAASATLTVSAHKAATLQDAVVQKSTTATQVKTATASALPQPRSPGVYSGSSLGARILAVAETRTGDWYSWGAAGPSTFDCSGLVYWAARQLGVNMPRDTYGMLSTGVASGVLVRVTYPRPGDLAFFGTGHVEFVYGPGETFGAQRSGTQVGVHPWYPGSWQPTAFYRIT